MKARTLAICCRPGKVFPAKPAGAGHFCPKIVLLCGLGGVGNSCAERSVLLMCGGLVAATASSHTTVPPARPPISFGPKMGRDFLTGYVVWTGQCGCGENR